MGARSARIGGEDARYLAKVLRVRPGSGLVLFNDSGEAFRAVVEAVSGGAVAAQVLEALPPLEEPETRVVLLQGLLKGQKMDLVIQKATELWAIGIVPAVTERSQVRETRKIERWRKISLEATRQCGRAMPPDVREPVAFDEYLDDAGPGLRGFIFTERGGGRLENIVPPGSGDVVVAVGPEGGFTEDEVARAVERGLKPVTLGGPVLRAETAAVSALTLVQYVLGNL
jgi:16S rRNA (uracil1498-N3)-methyltransferase